MKTKLKSIAIILGLLILLNVISLLIKPANAQLGFGGQVLTQQACPDQGGFLITIGPPAGGSYYVPPTPSPNGIWPPFIGLVGLGNAVPMYVPCSAAGIGQIGTGRPIIPGESGFYFP